MEKKAIRSDIITPTVKNSSIFCSQYIHSPQDVHVDPHIHKEMELLYQAEGRKTVFVNQTRYELTAGDIILFNGNTPHAVIAYRDTMDFFIQFKLDAETEAQSSFQSFLIFCSGNVFIFRSGTESNEAIKSCIRDVIEENQKQRPYYQTIIKSDVAKIIALLRRYDILKNVKTNSTPWFSTILDYIDSHYKDEISLSEISAAANVTPAHFCRTFRQITKTTFVNYLNFVRVGKAETLLKESNASITEIASQTGFSSTAYFSKIFRQYKFCTPGEYRKINTKV